MVDIIARIIAQRNNTSIITQDGFRWTKEQVVDLEDAFKNMVYTTQSAGQNAAKRFILSLKKIVALTDIEVLYVGSKTAGKILSPSDFEVKLKYDTTIFPNDNIPSEELITTGFTFTPAKLGNSITRITIVYQGKTKLINVNVEPSEYTGPDVNTDGNITNIIVDGDYVLLDDYGGVTITWEVNKNVI